MMATFGLIKYLADPENQLADIVYWQLGSLTNYDNLLILSPIIVLTTAILLAMRWRINVFSLGDREAKLIGTNIRIERGIMVGAATLLNVSAVCLTETIGWFSYSPPSPFIYRRQQREKFADDSVNRRDFLTCGGYLGAQFIYSRNSARYSHWLYRRTVLCVGICCLPNTPHIHFEKLFRYVLYLEDQEAPHKPAWFVSLRLNRLIRNAHLPRTLLAYETLSLN